MNIHIISVELGEQMCLIASCISWSIIFVMYIFVCNISSGTAETIDVGVHESVWLFLESSVLAAERCVDAHVSHIDRLSIESLPSGVVTIAGVSGCSSAHLYQDLNETAW